MDDMEKLVVVEGLRRLMARYVYAADHQQWDELASLFTPDGTFTPHDTDGTVLIRMEGREEIARALPEGVGSGAVLVHHLFSDLIDVESATSARGIWAMEDLVRRPVPAGCAERGQGFTEMHGYGHYRPRFTRIDGEWRIAELVLTRVRVDVTP
ncbi:nuclear transport factor 2 family protein [Streptomyces dioscori]|uniref:Nuclear transport factor 2 family protein n=1 Tax=Streptomyces dioscori TaxID=2109333 RepID=A0A2P8QAI2_9ACTN|nr:nuclear transport factor 2 family protein [Streptomyces dioscori]PSM43257.1 nuclear transport factor 2 family protein [Streptomyces dioscori]